MTDRALWNALRRRVRDWLALVDKERDDRERGHAQALRVVATYMEHTDRMRRRDRMKTRKGAEDGRNHERRRRGNAGDVGDDRVVDAPVGDLGAGER